jgi:GT2 family glycosyltransferase
LDLHRFIIIDNGSCEETKKWLNDNKTDGLCGYELLILPENIGTAEAINLGWMTRNEGEQCIKIDNDVVIREKDWIEQMEEVIERDPKIGQVGLKRKDCWETPNTSGFYKSTLNMLPHQPGEKWIVVEEVNHVMGTCVMHSSKLLDKVGYLWQPGLYGFDDSFMSLRSKLAGFKNVFLPHINIDHIDPGGTKYQQWKEQHAGEFLKTYGNTVAEFQTGKRSLYYSPYDVQSNNNSN